MARRWTCDQEGPSIQIFLWCVPGADFCGVAGSPRIIRGDQMPSKQKINLEKVKASLNTLCPKCGYSIPPENLSRVDFNEVQCPECGERFIPRVKDVRQTSSRLRESAVNFLHAFLGPLNAVRNELVRAGASLWPSEQNRPLCSNP